ncbi:DUF6632 domain-containing protein [Ramlibacter sp. 2FC]|uniref:DUF6632 domain-containing protein n=1 Tax=Ramlibacter sp. 2FC TaxID=2502188 RepID=UPI0010F5EAAF|nr:DUF6632 domain-containing protein [Ramlibacter sp. 2FC]
MNLTETHLRQATRVMQTVGWLCLAGLPAFAVLYPPGVLWGDLPVAYCLPRLFDHPPSPYDGLHPYFYMLAVMYMSYGYLMLRGARDPGGNRALFDFGIVANLAHGAIMIPMAFYYPNEHAHLWFDIPFAFFVVGLLMRWHPKRAERPA